MLSLKKKDVLAARACPDPGFGIYIHWPFCLSKCPYCDFNSHVREGVDHGRWERALVRELDYYAAQTKGRKVSSIFFGGGTPSLMSPRTVEAVINAVARHWSLSAGAEITLEANPTSVESGKFRDFRAGGINRLSLGVQALNDADLKFLGRQHSVAEALHAVELAAFFFPRFTFDLIYARPGQTMAVWQDELRQALSFAASHLSLYQLTIEQGTAFHTLYQRGDFVLPDEDGKGELYEMTQEMMEAENMPAYEISNHAKAGEESRHNLTYWRYGDYAGIGPGAHGRRGGLATVRHKKPENWLGAVARNGNGLRTEDRLQPAEQAREALLMGLRLQEGVDLGQVAKRCKVDVRTLVNHRHADVLEHHGLVLREGDRLTVTATGMLLLDRILVELVEV